MSVNSYEAAWKLAELERQFAAVLAETNGEPKMAGRYREWVMDVKAVLRDALPDNTELRDDFNSCVADSPTPLDDVRIVGLLRRARSALYMRSDDESERSLNEAVRLALGKISLQHWIVRLSGLALLVAAGFFFGGVFRIQSFSFDLRDEVDRARQEIITSSDEAKLAIIEERERYLVELESLSQRTDLAILEAKGQAEERIAALDDFLSEARTRINRAVDLQVDEVIPRYADEQMLRIGAAVDDSIDERLPNKVRGAEQRIDDAVHAIVNQDLPATAAEAEQRIDIATTDAIDLEKGRISDLVDVHINRTIPEHVQVELQRFDDAIRSVEDQDPSADR